MQRLRHLTAGRCSAFLHSGLLTKISSMKLFIKCANCKSIISFRTWCVDRVSLKMSKGDSIDLTCKQCNKSSTYDVDDLKARESKIAILVALAIFVIGTPVLLILIWDYLWQAGIYTVLAILFIIGVPIIVFGIINKQDSQRISRFNRS